MDLNKIFIKNACPTKIGGQAVLEGVMMRNQRQIAISVRKADGNIHTKKYTVKKKGSWAKVPFLRGVIAFIDSLVVGTGTLMYSAEVLEEDGVMEEEKGKFEMWLESRFGDKAAYNFAIFSSVIISLVFTIGVFIILPTVAVNWAKRITENAIILNLIEGLLRIAIFILYVVLISKLQDIKRVFQYHGAEHKTIHCYENGLELTVENCRSFPTLHPRCGTSFLVFVMIIALLIFSFLGWPNLFWRITSRLLLLPVIAGISYEVLQYAGRSDSWLVKILSYPGILLQKITTNEPEDDQLEIAIASMKASMEYDPEKSDEENTEIRIEKGYFKPSRHFNIDTSKQDKPEETASEPGEKDVSAEAADAEKKKYIIEECKNYSSGEDAAVSDNNKSDEILSPYLGGKKNESGDEGELNEPDGQETVTAEAENTGAEEK